MRLKKITHFILWASFLLPLSQLHANALEINNVQRLPAPNQDQIAFDLSWQNSWNVTGIPGNHDAAWVFIKYRECAATGSWNHAMLSTNMSDHSLDADLAFAQPISNNDRFGNPGAHSTGAMIRRANVGTGHIVSLPCTLRVVGGSGGAVFVDSLDYDIRVIGIEMVQVLEGAFAAGDNGVVTVAFSLATAASDARPVVIPSEAAITLYDSYCGTRTIPAHYPKGYSETYMMKYEISQGQYADFLNTIDGVAASQRYAGFIGNYRYQITSQNGAFFSSRPDRACNYLSWDDLCGYLDWAALRPMTELEYEKACKGNGAVGAFAFAWGDPFYVEAENVSGAEDGTEECIELNANLHCSTGGLNIFGGDANSPSSSTSQGPIGCGIFARDSTLSRYATGATYYGIMEMSGNVAEAVVSISEGDSTCGMNPSYDGIWGDGLLTLAGDFDTPNWPSASSLQASAVGHRGGGWSLSHIYGRIGNRYYMRYGGSNLIIRHPAVGGRGVR